MEEFLYFLAFVGIIIWIITSRNSTKTRSENLQKVLQKILEEQRKILKEVEELKQNQNIQTRSTYVSPSHQTYKEKSEQTTEKTTVELPNIVIPEVKTPVIEPLKVPEPEPILPTKPVEDIKVPVALPIEESILKAEPVLKTKPTPKAPTPPKPSFWERNPDLEKFIGENLINKIGIAILVLGIGFFVKFAIDQNWINEIGRVAIGIFCGGILIGTAHKLREQFKAFSSVLVGGGLAILYITIAIAFHDYQIFSQTVSFVIMVLITCFAVFLSMAYNRQELAIISFIGGFISPIMLSTGEGNYIVLFTYISILNIGMLTLAYFKAWKILNTVAYVFTIILFGAWLIDKAVDDKLPHLGALLFATGFFLIFFLMNIMNNIKEQKKFVIGEILMLVSNTFLYYSAGMYILANVEKGLYQGLFTVLIALFNMVFAYSLYRSKKVDSNVLYLLIGLVLTFASLAAPVQLEGNYITMFWSLEAVLLLWLSQKSGIQLIKLASVVVLVLMFISLFMDWANIYLNPNDLTANTTLIFNKGLMTSLLSILAVGMYIYLLKNEPDEFYGMKRSAWAVAIQIAFVILTYVGLLLEVQFQVGYRIAVYEAQVLYIGIYNFSFITVLCYWLIRQKHEVENMLTLFFFVIALLSYVFVYNFRIADIRDEFLVYKHTSAHYYFHYVLLALFVSIVWQVRQLIYKTQNYTPKQRQLFNWPFCFILIYLLSAEVEHLLVVSMYHGIEYTAIYDAKTLAFKIIFPILWGLCSFGMMYYGMSKKVKTIRIISLVVFSITLLKLFIFDVTEMSEGGKIAAFISLGALLLIISFMYQKLKKIIVDDEQKQQP